MFTVITKGNNVSKVSPLDLGIGEVSDDTIIIDDLGIIASMKGNPITWPTDATSGMQAIVDVKAGTLRFAYDGWPRSHTEFVVSNYVEDSAPVHVLDLIKEWPTDGTRPAVLVSPPGFSWRHHDGGVWSLCGMNGDSEFFEGHWLNYHENKKKYTEAQPANVPVTAASMLTAALGHMEDRAKTYDAPGGERSMGKTVAAFNAITGLYLTEEQGWLFMEILKQVRSQQGDYRADNYEDMVAYAALRGECAARERGNQSC